MSVLNLNVIRNTSLQNEPYPYLMDANFVNDNAIPEIMESFPDIKVTGFHPAAEMPLKGKFKQLIEEQEGPELSQALSEKFGMDFHQFPRLITIRKVSAAHEGRIHCDSKSKVMSLLVYLNDNWDSPDGRLRVLHNEKDMNNYAAEVPPKMGAVFAFLRRDNSWHGHTPFVGERKVIQVAWLRSQEEIDRKKSRHKVSKFLKKLMGKEKQEY